MPDDSRLSPAAQKAASRIFLSYAREDRESAEKFARLFAAQGWDVWWDRQLLPGQEFDSEIAVHLAQAECVVVLWSAVSVQKRWVRDEAEDGASRGILVPVIIDDVKIPLGFRRFQTVILPDWDGQEAHHPAVSELLTAVARLLHDGPVAGSMPKVRGRGLVWFALALGPTIFGLGCMWVFAHWKLPTPFRLAAAVSRMEFSIDAAEGPTKILESIPMQEAVFEKFSTFEIEPDRAEVADPALYDIGSDAFRASAWQSVTLLQPVVRFTTVSEYTISKVAIAGLSGAKSAAGVLDAVRVAPLATITLETSKLSTGLTLRLRGDHPRALFLWEAPIELVADHTAVNGMEPSGTGDSRSYRFYPKPSAPVANFTGRRSELVMSLRPAVDAYDKLKIGTGVTITSVDFTMLDDTGRRVSSIAAESSLSFPESSTLRGRRLAAFELLEIRNIMHAWLKGVQYDAARSVLTVSIEGEAGDVRIGSWGLSDDLKSNALSRLKDKRPLAIWLFLAAWLVSTCVGLAKLVRRWKGRTRLLSSP